MSADSYGVRLAAVPRELLQVTATFANQQGAMYTAVGFGETKTAAVASAQERAQAWVGRNLSCLSVSTPETILADLELTA